MPIIFSPGEDVTPMSLQALLSSTPLLRAATDRHGRLLGLSAGLRSATGLHYDGVGDISFCDLLSGESAAEVQALLEEHGRTGRIFTVDAWLREADGKSAPVLINATPLRAPGDADKTPRGHFLTIVELSDSRFYRQALQARRAAEDADARKTRLLAQVSHEVRTPLNIIMGYMQLARAGDVGETEAGHIDTALAALAGLTGQLASALDRSDAPQGPPPPDLSPFDIV